MTDPTPDRPVMGDHPELESDAVPPATPIVESRNPVSWTLIGGGVVLALVVVLMILLIV